MQSIKLTRQSPFSAQQMFDLITDVDRYDEFIPYCTAARVRGARNRDAGRFGHWL